MDDPLKVPADEEPPWVEWSRSRLRPGMSYPLRQAEIAEALRDARTTIDSVHLYTRPTSARYDGRDRAIGRLDLLKAIWDPFPIEGLWRAGRELWLYAVPSDQRQRIRSVLLGGVLATACRWLAETRARGNAWQAYRHELRVHLVGDEVVTESRDGWPTLRGR